MSTNFTKYGKSEHGNFEIVDSLGIPHPYCITPKHVKAASDHNSGMLDPEICEKYGAKCGVRGCKLKWNEHEKALLVSCKKDIKGSDGKGDPELVKWLNDIKDQATKDGYGGFAFKKDYED